MDLFLDKINHLEKININEHFDVSKLHEHFKDFRVDFVPKDALDKCDINNFDSIMELSAQNPPNFESQRRLMCGCFTSWSPKLDEILNNSRGFKISDSNKKIEGSLWRNLIQ